MNQSHVMFSSTCAVGYDEARQWSFTAGPPGPHLPLWSRGDSVAYPPWPAPYLQPVTSRASSTKSWIDLFDVTDIYARGPFNADSATPIVDDNSTQLSLTNCAMRLEVSQGHQTIWYVRYGFPISVL